MKVILEAFLFEQDPDQTRTFDLLTLIHLGFEGRHLVTTEPLVDDRVSNWLAARGPEESACCHFAFDSAVTQLSRLQFEFCIRVRQGQSPPSLQQNELILSLADALIFLRLAFRVLLEDEVRDGNFVLAVAKPEWRKRLLDMKAKGWLRFEHSGGITRLLETVKQCAGDLFSRTTIWVLFDSDSLAPGRPSRQARDLTNICLRGINFHCLERRAVENYIPLLALKHWAEHHSDSANKRRLFRAFCTMEASSRFHYNLKRGFHGDSGRDDLENVGSLYDGLSPADKQALDHGFGDHIADLFGRHNWTNWEWWMSAGREREEGGRMIQALFSKL